MKIIGGLRSIGYAMRASYRTGFFKMSQSMRSKNTCKSCAYGSGGQRGGMTDEAGNYPEVCKKSFQANLSDIQNAIDPDIFNRFSIDDFRRMNGREIDRLGRLTHTIYKNAGDTHYRIISPSEAIRIISEKMKSISGRRSFFYNSGRSSNEAGFLLQLFARLYGSNNISNSAYYCHQASGAGISSCIGTGTAT
ncbi:MAG: histidine kinase, partial [Bacteroidota bacterium]